MTQTPATIVIKQGNGTPTVLQGDVDGAGVFTTRSTPSINGIPVSPSNPLATTVKVNRLTAAPGDTFAVATGGTPVLVFGAGEIDNGAFIVNPVDQNNGMLIVDMVNIPGITAPGAEGTSEAIPPGGRWDAPGPLTGAVYANAENPQSFTAVRF